MIITVSLSVETPYNKTVQELHIGGASLSLADNSNRYENFASLSLEIPYKLTTQELHIGGASLSLSNITYNSVSFASLSLTSTARYVQIIDLITGVTVIL